MPAHRPELLALSLDALANARNRPEVHIYADTQADLRELEIVRDLYLPEAFLFYAKPHTKAPSGTWNILNAIRDASRWAENVYLVEEDVLVYPYFFEWHSNQNAPASCGRKIPRFDLYTNPGSCLRRPLLDKLIPHITEAYFRDTEGYCAANFPPVHISTLDDGLIRRVLAVNGFEWVFPDRPVCAHVGIPGMKRKDTGGINVYNIIGETLEERIECVRKLVADPPYKESYARGWEPFKP